MDDVAAEEAKGVRGRLLQWEASEKPLAALSSRHQNTLYELMEAAAHRPYPSQLKQEAPKEEKQISTPPSDLIEQFARLEAGLERLGTAQEMLSWLESAKRQVKAQKHASFYGYRVQLDHRRQECVQLLKLVEAAISQLDRLQGQFVNVSGKTIALHTLSEQLMVDQSRLAALEAALEERLRPFAELDALAFQLNSPTLTVNSESFEQILDKLDTAFEYIEKHPSYKESRAYLSKCSAQRARVVALVRAFVFQALQGAAAGAATGSLDANSFALFYGRFQAVVPRVRPVIALLEARQLQPDYRVLLEQAHQHFVGLREGLLSPSVQASVSDLVKANKGDHCSLVRASCSFLVHLSKDEHLLFTQFFDAPTSPTLRSYLEVLCGNLYDELRPLIIHINHLETLAELCSILRLEMLEEHVQANPEPLAAFGRLAWQLLQDVQERLVFRAHLYLKSDIEQYKAAPGDLAYPEKLEMMESIALGLQQDGQNSQVATPFSRTGSSPADLHGMWYPTVRRTLGCLSRLYRCVDRAIFQGLSQEALSACVQSIAEASTAIKARKTPIDAELFQVKHLLILREQIAPFQVDFTIRETSLDFSHVRNAAAGFLNSNKGRIFALGSSNSILELILAGTTNLVKENLRDSRKEVDHQLKIACEALIQHATDLLVQELNMLLLQVQHYETAGGTPANLHSQEWASAERVSDVVSASLKRIKTHLPLLQRSLQLYLANRETEFILYRPIKNKVVGAFLALQQALTAGGYSADQLLVVGCPTPEQVSVMLSASLATSNLAPAISTSSNPDEK